jgi:hypothetical protein
MTVDAHLLTAPSAATLRASTLLSKTNLVLVPVEGIEPSCLVARDFESGAYQNETDYEMRLS